MKRLVLIFLLLSVVACKSIRYVPVRETQTITVHDTLIEVELRYQTDTVETEVVKDGPSHSFLENRYCKSSADLVEGRLVHTLTVKSGAVDTVTVHDIKKVEVTKELPVEIKVEPSKWERMKMSVNGLIIGLIIGTLVSLVRRRA